jgi:predicted transcriptional regulator
MWHMGMTRAMLVSVKVPAALGVKLAAVAAERRLSKSHVVRQALEAALSRRRTVARRRSFTALAGDLAGCASGPVDLSHHPRHLRGYGR